jgi:hypothetical protein
MVLSITTNIISKSYPMREPEPTFEHRKLDPRRNFVKFSCLFIGDNSGSCPFLPSHISSDSLTGDDLEMILMVMDSTMVKILNLKRKRVNEVRTSFTCVTHNMLT